jgi:DNA-binding transcriptional MocR family regulator
MLCVSVSGMRSTFPFHVGGYHLSTRLKKPVIDTELLEAAIRHGVEIVSGQVYGPILRAFLYVRLDALFTQLPDQFLRFEAD